MSKTRVETGTDTFFHQIRLAAKRVLLIDYDGTIAPFHCERHRATPYPEITGLLRCVMDSCRTRLIIVTGRSARELPQLLGIHPTPEIWGTYGIERIYGDGSHREMPVSETALEVLAHAEAELDRAGLGDRLEVKLAAVALHWRGLRPAEVLKIRTIAYRTFGPLALTDDLSLCEFEGGVEIRLSSANKGDAVRDLVSELDADVPIAYLGDDTTDEDAFRTLNDRGLTALVASKRRFTAAQMWLRPPQDVIGFLVQWIVASGGVQ